ncbi:MAG: class I SAM-dependent methyltransferase [Chloroflexota bacterium]|nr:class I SAM-dependent methyltransferase [Chloroflexota bacterium]
MLAARHVLGDVVREGVAIRTVEDDIYSVLPESESKEKHLYDKQAGLYDALVGNPLYLRVAWENRREDYTRFAQEALRSAREGWFLDAGCGSLLFTAGMYSRNLERPAVLLDQSIEMLKRGRARLVKRNGGVPENVYLLQGDLMDLPFRDGVFTTVMSMSTLHLFENGRELVANLTRQLAQGGELYMMSLVLDGSKSDGYLRFLNSGGQVATPRSPEEVVSLFAGQGGKLYKRLTGNMMYMKLVGREQNERSA